MVSAQPLFRISLCTVAERTHNAMRCSVFFREEKINARLAQVGKLSVYLSPLGYNADDCQFKIID